MTWDGRHFGIVAAPTNLGLRPPEPSAVPGTAKAPEALREAGLHRRLSAWGVSDLGCVLPGRYRDDAAPAASRLRNERAIVDHARRLASRLDDVLDQGRRPLVLGGDCGLIVGAGICLRRRGRYGLVHIDGHTDFRHPGNSARCASLAGEDLAAAVGLHWPAVSDIDGLSPYFRPDDTVHVGCRADDEFAVEVSRVLADVVPAESLVHEWPAASSRITRVVEAGHLDGYWIHLDVDVLDPSVMPAVDSPAPGGLDPKRLTDLLRRLLPHAAGMQVCVYDPDLDPDGTAAELLVDVLADAWTPEGHAH